MTTQHQPDRVRQYLRRRGCSQTVVKHGLQGLISNWESCVSAVEEGYDLTLRDYRHDMDLRDILQGALDAAAEEEQVAGRKKVARLDQRFRELTVECGPIHGEAAAREDGHDPESQWWFFRRPKRPSPDFEEELREADLV